MADFPAKLRARRGSTSSISGGTGSGKTTLLNMLSGFIPDDERIVTIEDAAELQLQQEHVVRLETRPPNIEGQGRGHASATWSRNALRMRPDRIVVGEVPRRRGARHAPGDEHRPRRLADHRPRQLAARRARAASETMVLMAGIELPVARHPRADRSAHRPHRAQPRASATAPARSPTSPRSSAWKAT